MEREYSFTFSASAVTYLLFALDQRPRGESKQIAGAIEALRAEQDAEYDKRTQQKAPATQPQETWERVTNGLDRSSDIIHTQEARQ